MHQLRRFLAAAVVVLSTLAVSAPADAHQSPAGCNTSGANIQLLNVGIFNLYRNGDVVSAIPQYSNNANNVCDVTDATITISFPKPDGTAGPKQVVATGLDLPAGTPPTKLPAVQHKIELNDGTFRGDVELELSGTFHWVGTHTPGRISTLTSPLVITRPHATIDVTTDPAAPDAGAPFAYKYAVTNDSPLDPEPGATSPTINTVALTDDRCGPVPSAHTGDANMNDSIDRGETWVFSCTTSLPFGGTFTNNVSMTGITGNDGRPLPAMTGQGTVTVNGPDMTLTKSHSGDFTQGDKARTYSLVARNSGNRPASGDVSVADTLPAGLNATAIAGEGWDCTLGTLTCTRSDMLAGGESYPPITVTVDAADAPASVTNTAKVTRAGQNTANDDASDATTIKPPVAEEPKPTPDDTPGGGTGEQPGGDGQTGGGTDGPQTNEDQTPRDTTAPALSTVSISNRKFTVVAPRVASARAKKGTRFAYSLSESARVTFTIERRVVSRRTGRVRYVRVGEFTQDAVAGANRRRWLGTLGSKRVRPGSYRASIVATDAAGNKSAARRVGFKVVRR